MSTSISLVVPVPSSIVVSINDECSSIAPPSHENTLLDTVESLPPLAYEDTTSSTTVMPIINPLLRMINQINLG
ncbi:hypothetical protein IAR50_005260 [Cryptococcus sp. DSM 104548]